MSVDETQYLDNSEIDFAASFRTIWFNKFSLMFFIMLSVPVSVFYSTTLKPTYKAVTVFEKPQDELKNDNRLLDNSGGAGLLGILTGGSVSSGTDSFYSEIRSESLLKTVILNNKDFDSQTLQKFCPLPSKEVSRFSLRSLLILFGISENRAPNENQKISLLVQCVNNMLEIKFDNFGPNESSAYRLSVTSADPVFSANLANQIVEKYFVRHKRSKEKKFQSVKTYLAKVIAESQLELTEANKLMQDFIIKNALLMNIEPSTFFENANVSFPFNTSPFSAKLKKDVFSLSQLENSLSKLKRAKLKLLNLNRVDQEETFGSILSTDIQEVLSSTFIGSISKIDVSSIGTDFNSQKIRKLVSEEIQILGQQIQALEEKINNGEEQTVQLMTIENRYQELAIDFSKKRLIFEGLKDQLKEKILSTGLAGVAQPVLLTKAVPPFNKASPNKKLIVALGLVLSIFIGIGYILVRQSYLRRIISLSQLQNLSSFLSFYKIKYKQLKLTDKRSGETLISQSFFSQTKDVGKLGCVIDLSQKNRGSSLASEFSKSLANLLAANSTKIVCLNTLTSKKLFSASSRKDFETDNSVYASQDISNSSITTVNDDDGMIGAGELMKIKNKYSDYDKIICAIGTEIGDLTKFKFIEQCDFYILIGRCFDFDEYIFRRFSNTVWEKEKKCLGFFLID
ncbi:hypothetical protein N9U70_00330 [Paracoccaceae bacterium]|nr:hypothetical protein [Paracoccaceae bacterium]